MQLIQILAIIFSLGIFVTVIDLIRRGMLKEEYSILWLVSTSVLLLLSIWRELLHSIAKTVGVAYPPSLLFLVAFLFLLLIVLHFSVIISGLNEKNKRLSQELAILKAIVDSINEGNSEDKKV